MRIDTNKPSVETIQIRLTTEEKQRIKDYCVKHHITISDFIRSICFKVFDEKENEQ